RAKNLPQKSNFLEHKGLDARTGKSNFDISESMLIRLIELIRGRSAMLAMLCKTTVARKVLSHVWKRKDCLANLQIRRIDAGASFGAASDSFPLLAPRGSPQPHPPCRVYRRLCDAQPVTTIGFHNNQLIADMSAFDRWKHLEGQDAGRWRSGVKHDCSRVM